MKFIKNFSKGIKENIIISIITLVLGVGFIFLYVYVLNSEHDVVAACNGSTIVAFVYLGIGGLILISRYGMFDGLIYGSKTLIHYTFHKEKEKKYDDFVDYTNKRRDSRNEWPHHELPFFYNGILFLLLLAIFEILYHL